MTHLQSRLGAAKRNPTLTENLGLLGSAVAPPNLREVKAFQRCVSQSGSNLSSRRHDHQAMPFPLGPGLRLVAQGIWHQGIRRPVLRGQFWRQLGITLTQRPQILNTYLGLCAAGEHFWEYRSLVRRRISDQIGLDSIRWLQRGLPSQTPSPWLPSGRSPNGKIPPWV